MRRKGDFAPFRQNRKVANTKDLSGLGDLIGLHHFVRKRMRKGLEGTIGMGTP
jgi:hypothetical protein